MNDKVKEALEHIEKRLDFESYTGTTLDKQDREAYNIIKSALQHNNVSRDLQLELKRLKGDIEISKIEEIGLYNKYDGKQSNPKGHLLQHIEKIEELLNFPQLKTLEQQREEIIAELNELGIFNNAVRYLCTETDRRFVYDSPRHTTRTIVKFDKIEYIQDWELTWWYDLPIELAHKITSYFMAIKRVDEEIEVDRNE